MSTPTTTTVWITDASSIAQFNRGPIATAFSPPSSCTATLSLNGGATGLYFGHFAYSYIDVACYPTGTKETDNLVTGNWDIYYYSPAICPYGWSTATTFQSSLPANYPTTNEFITLGLETTAALCCPSGYSYYTLGHQCTSTLTENQIIGYVFAKNNGVSWDRGVVSTTTMATGSTVWGDGVPIWYQSADEALLSSASTKTPVLTKSEDATASTTAAHSLHTASIPSSTDSPVPTNTVLSQSAGLSTGAKIGIGVAIPLGVIAAIAIAFLLLRRRRRDRTVNGGAVYEADTVPANQAEGYKTQQPARRPVEIHTHPEEYHSMHELPATGYR